MNQDRMSQNNTEVPDNAQLERMLGHFAPTPSPRFYRILAGYPWMKRSSATIMTRSKKIKLIQRLVFGSAITLFVIILFGIILFPSVRALALQIINNFTAAPSNQIEVNINSTNPDQLLIKIDPGTFTQSIIDSEKLAGYHIYQFQKLPTNLTFIGTKYEPSYKAVLILYQSDRYSLIFTQRPIGDGKDVFSIGSNAEIELVKIGDKQGEFVRGGWKAISKQTLGSTLQPGYDTNINAQWDNTLSQYTLRWQNTGNIYEIRAFGLDIPSQNELITLANELK